MFKCMKIFEFITTSNIHQHKTQFVLFLIINRWITSILKKNFGSNKNSKLIQNIKKNIIQLEFEKKLIYVFLIYFFDL